MDKIIEDAMVATVATLVKERVEELGYDMNNLPAKKYIDDEILVWLANKYEIMDNNIKLKKGNNNASDKN